MKCMNCGKNIGIFSKKIKPRFDEVICESCLKDWGFTEEDLKDPKYVGSSFRYLMQGKKEIDEQIARAEYEKAHTKVKWFDLGEADKKTIAEAKSLTDKDELYDGYTDKELKEDLNEETQYIFSGITFDCELKDGGVWFEGRRIADAPEIPTGSRVSLVINGGKYKKLVFDDYDEMSIVKGEKPYYLALKAVYIE